MRFYTVKLKPKSGVAWNTHDIVALLTQANLITAHEQHEGRQDGDFAGRIKFEPSEHVCYRDAEEVARVSRNYLRIEKPVSPNREWHKEISYEWDDNRDLPRNATIIDTEDVAIIDFLRGLPQIRSVDD